MVLTAAGAVGDRCCGTPSSRAGEVTSPSGIGVVHPPPRGTDRRILDLPSNTSDCPKSARSNRPATPARPQTGGNLRWMVASVDVGELRRAPRITSPRSPPRVTKWAGYSGLRGGISRIVEHQPNHWDVARYSGSGPIMRARCPAFGKTGPRSGRGSQQARAASKPGQPASQGSQQARAASKPGQPASQGWGQQLAPTAAMTGSGAAKGAASCVPCTTAPRGREQVPATACRAEATRVRKLLGVVAAAFRRPTRLRQRSQGAELMDAWW